MASALASSSAARPGIVRGRAARPPRHAEGGEGGVELAVLGEQLGVGRIGAGIAALDIVDAKIVEHLGDRQLVVEREIDAVRLRAVAQRGVEEIEAFAGHGVTKGNSSAPARRRRRSPRSTSDDMMAAGSEGAGISDLRSWRALLGSELLFHRGVGEPFVAERTVLRCCGTNPRRLKKSCALSLTSAVKPPRAARGRELLQRVDQHGADAMPRRRRMHVEHVEASGPSSEAKPTGEPSIVPSRVKCLGEPRAERGLVVRRGGPGLALGLAVVVRGRAPRCWRERFRPAAARQPAGTAAARAWDGRAPSSRSTFQVVVPSFLSSSSTPIALSSSRMRSDSLKFFALRAALRASIASRSSISSNDHWTVLRCFSRFHCFPSDGSLRDQSPERPRFCEPVRTRMTVHSPAVANPISAQREALRSLSACSDHRSRASRTRSVTMDLPVRRRRCTAEACTSRPTSFGFLQARFPSNRSAGDSVFAAC